MATITTSYTYTDGNVLDPDGHNQNLFSATSGEGIYSESNGGLSSSNLHSTFRVRAEHVLPGAMVIAANTRRQATMHYYSDIVGSDGPDEYVSVDAVRFRLPFDTTTMMLHVSFFVSPWLWIRSDADPIDPGILYDMNARTQVWFNGIALEQSEYPLPHAGIYISGALLNRAEVGRCAVQRNHTYMVTDALDRGDYEVSLRVALEDAPRAGETMMWPAGGTTATAWPAKRHGRVTFGALHIVAVAFKKANS